MAEEAKEEKKNGKGKKAGKIAAIVGLISALAILALLLVNSLLSVFVRHYYPTFGGYRLFAIVSDSMEPEIPTGSMISSRVPKSEADIEVGSVITYEITQNNKSVTLITHRVVAVHKNEATGEITYTTRGDNVSSDDGIMPSYSDVVGVYTGSRCGFFGYLFGFLQSTQGAIALILIGAIALIAYIVVRFVNMVNVWRSVAVAALKKSGNMISDTQNGDLGVIADVIGIAVKDPKNRQDERRKNKKLDWFIRTGRLPKRPYADDLDENASMEGMGETETTGEIQTTPEAETKPAQPKTSYVEEEFEQMKYVYTFTAKIIGLKPQQKEWYSRLKNELLGYGKVRANMGKRDERFSLGRKTVARIAVRGKTLCLLAAQPAEFFADKKYKVKAARGGEYSLYKVTSERSLKKACVLIADVMAAAGATKRADYEPMDYYMPREGIMSLMAKKLVKRDLHVKTKTYKIEEVPRDENS